MSKSHIKYLVLITFFFILSSSPAQAYISFSFPNLQSQLEMGKTYTIRWSGNESGVVSLVLVQDKGGRSDTATIVSEISSTQGSYSWTIPTGLYASDGYKIDMRGKAWAAESDYFRIITPTSVSTPTPIQTPIQTVTIISPRAGDTWQIGKAYVIEWRWSYLTGSGDTASLILINDKGGRTEVASIAPAICGSCGKFVWGISKDIPANSGYKIELRGKALSAESGYFSIVAPTSPYVPSPVVAPLPTAAPGDYDNGTVVSSCFSIQNNLRYRTRDWSVNGEVSTLQDFLATKGYLKSEPTGFLGILTMAAVQKFQSDQGIAATGFVGPITRAKIRALTCN